MLEYILIIFVGFAGVFLAYYLHHKKHQKKEHFICPFKGKCTDVINSDFSKFFGIPVELLGMAYYASIAIGYGFAVVFSAQVPWLTGVLLTISFGAFLFSLYLTFIQVVVLKKLCTWCLLSAAFTTIIAALAVYGSLEVIGPFLGQYREGFLVLHLLGMAMGLGSATLVDFFFFRYLKDFRISKAEASVLSAISEFIWFALGIIILSGMALYLPEAASYNANPKFIMKALIVLILIVNGAFLNLVVTPKMVKISFGKKHDHQDAELVKIRRIAFGLGPISIVSWYSAFILGALRETPFTFVELFLIYSTLIILGLLGGRLAERYYMNQAKNN